MSPEAKEQLKSATNAMEAAVDAAYQAGKRDGIEIGVEQERERLKKALFSDEKTALQPEPHPEENANLTRAVMAAGSLMNMARLMLAKDRDRSFSVTDVIDYYSKQYRATVTAEQVRAILKVLTRSGEAERLERGVYTAGSRLQVQTSLIGGA
jgi:type IV secretory pathway VirJ component